MKYIRYSIVFILSSLSILLASKKDAFANIDYYTAAGGTSEGSIMGSNGIPKGISGGFDKQGKQQISTGTISNQVGAAGATADTTGNSLSAYAEANSPCSKSNCSVTIANGGAYINDTLIFKNLPTTTTLITLDLAINWILSGSESKGNSAGIYALLSATPYGDAYNEAYTSFSFNKAGSSSKILSIEVAMVQDPYSNQVPYLNFFAQVDALTSSIPGNSAGDSASVDPSITVLVPSGVTFTSASGANYMGGSPTIAAIPEPPTGVLILAGLLCLAFMSRRDLRMTETFARSTANQVPDGVKHTLDYRFPRMILSAAFWASSTSFP
ncbi:hypothetical protein [Ferrovum sp.]|uniref:hypothetical protein n=1 Tax=Ferrovum sp. TaxID=2609467 RepID=UPI0026095422|nr:hypothetical protein [Ferrovum sp.]